MEGCISKSVHCMKQLFLLMPAPFPQLLPPHKVIYSSSVVSVRNSSLSCSTVYIHNTMRSRGVQGHTVEVSGRCCSHSLNNHSCDRTYTKEGVELLRILPYTSVNVHIGNGQWLEFTQSVVKAPKISVVNGQNAEKTLRSQL